MHFHFRVAIKMPLTLSEHCISQSARFKNTMIELLKSSTDPQISKGVDALKQLFFEKKGYSSFEGQSGTLKKNQLATICQNCTELSTMNYQVDDFR